MNNFIDNFFRSKYIFNILIKKLLNLEIFVKKYYLDLLENIVQNDIHKIIVIEKDRI